MADSSTESEGDDVIRLSLRKPKAWKWSLTTSVSSPGVVVPVIQLWDSEQGSILVDTGSNPKAVKKRSKTVSFERHVSKQSDKCLSRSKSDNAKRVSWGENRPLQQSDEPVKRRDNDETERHIVYRSLEKKHERKEEPSRSLSLSSKDSWNARFAKPNDYVVPRIPVSVARKVSLTTTTSSVIPEEASGSNTKARPTSGIPRFTKSNVDATTTRKDKDTLQNDKLPHRNNIIVLRNDILPGRNKATALNDRKAKNNESVVPSVCSVKQNKPNDSNGPRFLKQDNASDINVSKASCSSGLKKPSPVRRPCQEKVVKITPTKRAESSPEKVNNTPTKRAESSPEKVNNTLKKRAESSPEKVNNTPTKRAESSLEKVNNTLKKRAELSPEKVNNTLTKRAESSPEKVNKPGVINKQRKVEMELCFSGPNRHTFDVRRTRSANDKALGKQSSQQNRESSAEKTTSKIPTSSQLGKPKVTRYPVNRNVDCPSDQRKPNTCVSPIKDCNSNKNNNINKCSNKKIETAQQNSKPGLVVNKSRIPSLCGGLKPTNSGKDVRDNAAKRDAIRARRLRAECRHRIEKQYCSSSSDTETNQTHMDCQRRKRRSLNIKGDRLVAINGQCVRCPEEAGELLRESGDVVRLQLVRNGVGSQSLPRHGVKVELPEDTDSEMGSNMSRHSGKGLTGRRSQSSGNLCNGKIIGSNVARYFSPCSRVENSVGPRDRYKFCGSLPNHLDAKDPVEVDEISDDPSSFKNNNNVATLNNHHHPLKNDLVELRLHPLVSGSVHHHVHQDSATNDQGYASERSPEEELPPDLPAPIVSGTCPLHHRTGKAQYPFINKNSTFTVTLVKGSRGLGLSVTGGVDTNEQWPGLIRIKRLFPHQPAWESGQLAQGDILLVANNIPLTGLTNYEALEVLRTTPTDVVLTVCRPPPELQVLNTPAPTAPAPVPPRRDTQSSTSSLLLPLKRETYGEFDITLSKVNGSLGFTLRKEDESVLGHYVRALVREPALSDSRIKPGDKIVAVNGVDLSPMSHEEAVMFLRQCGQEVHLRLFRDPAQTPVAALSPTEGHRTFKPILRKEAQDMLSDLAVKKSMSPDDSTGSSTLSRLGRSSSPRKRRLTKMPSPDSQINGTTHLPWSNEVLNQVIPGWDNERPQRPDFLNLNAERKPHFQFVAAPYTVHEETGGSCEELDSSSHVHDKENENADDFGVGPLPSEPVSMPPLSSNSTASLAGFSYRNPAYRSANPATNTKSKSSLSEELPDSRCSDNDLPVGNTVEGSKGLLKWKGVVFTPEDGENSNNSPEDSISQITETDEAGSQSEGVGQVLVVELNRGWNSRLGFSLQQVGRNSVISAIYPDSVASRDGRLKSGDQLIMVNDESVEGMTTSEVIDLLRKIRGSICITVWRKQS